MAQIILNVILKGNNMEEKDIALMLLEMAKTRLTEINDLIDSIKDLDDDYVWYADLSDLEAANDKFDEFFSDVKKGIRRS